MSDRNKAVMVKDDRIFSLQNFDKILERAIAVFSEQGFSDEKSLAQIELTKAKANNFIDSISNIMAISHEIEILKSEKDRFTRTDELVILNNLREQCNMQAEVGTRLMESLQNKILGAIESGEDLVDSEYMGILQEMLDRNINTTQKIINSSAKLIQLERFSGSRPWGTRINAQAGNINYIKGLDSEDSGTSSGSKKDKIRSVDVKELEKLCRESLDYEM